MKTVKQVAAREVRHMIPTIIFGIIVLLFEYVMSVKVDDKAYVAMAFALVWFTMHLLVLINERLEIKIWCKTTGRIYE